MLLQISSSFAGIFIHESSLELSTFLTTLNNWLIATVGCFLVVSSVVLIIQVDRNNLVISSVIISLFIRETQKCFFYFRIGVIDHNYLLQLSSHSRLNEIYHKTLHNSEDEWTEDGWSDSLEEFKYLIWYPFCIFWTLIMIPKGQL